MGTPYDRWKYAEEAAKRLIDDGHLIAITMLPDVKHVEKDGVYVYDEFHVHDLGMRDE